MLSEEASWNSLFRFVVIIGVLLVSACAKDPYRIAHNPGFELKLVKVEPNLKRPVEFNSIVSASLRYKIRNFQKGKYFASIQFETWAKGSSKGTSPGDMSDLPAFDAATGIIQLKQPILEAWADPYINKPLRLKFVMMEMVGPHLSKVVAETNWYSPEILDTSDGDDDEDWKALQGEWTVIAGSFDGGVVHALSPGQSGMTFDGNHVTSAFGSQAARERFYLDETNEPHKIDMVHMNKNGDFQVTSGSYKLQDDDLQVVLSTVRGERPVEVMPSAVCGCIYMRLHRMRSASSDITKDSGDHKLH